MRNIVSTSKWIRLQSCRVTIPDKLLMINNDEFVHFDDEGIHKYNINENKWTKIADANKIGAIDGLCYKSTINKQEQSIYSCAADIFSNFNLNKMTENVLSNNEYDFGPYPVIIDINNEIHIIGGYENVHHFIWNKELKQMNKVYKFKEFDEGLERAEFVYLKEKQRILIFGGSDCDWKSFYRSIHEYSLLIGNWSKLNLILPKKITDFGLISTRFDEFVVVLGGYDLDKDEDTNDIFVLNIHQNYKWMKSKIKCPEKDEYNAIITDNSYNDEVLTFGFINDCFKSWDFQNMQYVPHYIIKLISNWVCYQNIHLINSNGAHWKIDVDDILNEIEEL